MKRYFLGLSSAYSAGDTLRHTFAIGSEYDLSELRAFLAAHYGATYDHVAVYSNGRTALNIAVKSLVKRGGKVVITSLTCYAVVQAVKTAGCVPVFADIDKKTLHFGAKELEEAIAGETDVQAVIVQNNLGIPVDIEAIEEVAKRHKLIIIEDLAHSAGVKYADGREAGTVGRATVLSFGKGKAIDTITGGAVVFSDPLDAPVKQPAETPAFKENFRARIYPLISAIIRGGYRLNRKLGRGLSGLFVKIHAIKRSADGNVEPDLRLTFWQSKLALLELKNMPHRGRKPLRDFYLVDDRDTVLAELSSVGYEFSDLWYETPVAPERYFHKADFHSTACPVATEVATQIVNVPSWYDKEEMKPALKIIKQHLLDTEAISEEAVKEREKTAQEKEVEARKEARAKAKKEKAKAALSKVNPTTALKNVKLPKIKIEKAGKKGESSKDTKKGAGKDASSEGDSREGTGLEEKSELLSKMDKKTEEKKVSKSKTDGKDMTEKTSETGVAKKASKTEVAKEKLSEEELREAEIERRVRAEVERELARAAKRETAKKAGPVKKVEPATRVSGPVTSKPEPTVRKPETTTKKPELAHVVTKEGSMPGMRVAPEKLSDREKLKQELEQGKKGEKSVF